MLRFLTHRLTRLPLAILGVHFLGFAYALWGRWFQTTQNPFFVAPPSPPNVWPDYAQYLGGVAQGNWAMMPGSRTDDVLETLTRGAQASLGLLGIAFGLALAAGLLLGLLAVRASPPGVRGWLIPLSSLSLSMPSFYIGAVILTITIYYLLFLAPKGSKLLLPLRGYGWDAHLILPVLVLSARPAMQIAQVAATTLAEELRKQYATASRSLGHSWMRLRWRTALKNAWPTIIITAGNALRWLMVELVVVEWLFGWPGLGSLLAAALVRPQIATIGAAATALPAGYLFPPIVAATLASFAALFWLADLVSAALVRWLDPRLME
jgi:ABC-type dipeptide/oligopeptide/nickel transport system permease component